RRRGGLKDRVRVTYWTFVIGSLAMSGSPLTAGFFSKDDLLVSTWSAGQLGDILTIFGLLTALMTAFYSFRLVFVTFWGPSHLDPHYAGHVREPAKTMTVPLMVLAVLSIIYVFFGIQCFLLAGFCTGAG